MHANKSKIVYEAVIRIQKLQNTFNKLESQKLERLEENNIMLMGLQKVGNRWEKYAGNHGSTCNSTAIIQANHGSSPFIPTVFMIWSSPNVVLNVAGEDAILVSVVLRSRDYLPPFVMFWRNIKLTLCQLEFHLINSKACSWSKLT